MTVTQFSRLTFAFQTRLESECSALWRRTPSLMHRVIGHHSMVVDQ